MVLIPALKDNIEIENVYKCERMKVEVLFTIVKIQMFTFVNLIECMEIIDTEKLFEKFKLSDLFGRYITSNMIAKPLLQIASKTSVEEVGLSVQGRPIHLITVGNGPIRIFLWSQMHGNESTTTKALFDFVQTILNSDEEIIHLIASRCTIGIIPMLNPDGAEAYSRNNANDIDLNRDAVELSQPESKILRNCYKNLLPHYCFNLHGQRTIFSAGKTPNPAAVSFLAPTQDNMRSITESRKEAMSLIIGIRNKLENLIPNSIGVYDDSFNINCVGDYFQSQNVPTVLFEAGHFKQDYNREYVRYLIYLSLLEAMRLISTQDHKTLRFEEYFNIPQNEKLYYDVIIRNASTKKQSNDLVDLAFQFQEELKDGRIHFLPKLEKISVLKNFFAHHEINAKGESVKSVKDEVLNVGYANDFVLMNNQKTSLKSENFSII